LRNDARLLRDVRREGVVEVVRVLQRVRQDELRPHFAIQSGQLIESVVWHAHRVIAQIKELNLSAQNGGGTLSLVFTVSLHLFQCHPCLAPQLGGFSALAERQADNDYFPSARRV
jgi:hypothetical protein